ncbi:hypothetical protein, partial [Sphingomonas sp. CFBP 13706]|uniref:hypothetical protein n=1 Tax=Sphingomonas sp. CFBP 13706 TaxID=2775314 RepID=UPI001A7ECA66
NERQLSGIVTEPKKVDKWALADWQLCRLIAATRLSSTVGTRRAPERRDLVESGLAFLGGRT